MRLNITEDRASSAADLLRFAVCLALAIGLTTTPSGTSAAHDGWDTPWNGIVSIEDRAYPGGGGDERYNGYKVFLSSPRHPNSGYRGECRNPGYEENVNGRRTNWYAAMGRYYNGGYYPTLSLRNIHSRGYYTEVSKNLRDNGYANNRTMSENWGANLHIVTHTNATYGCPSSASYLLTMYEHSRDQALAWDLGNRLNPAIPGSWLHQLRTRLYELETNASHGDAYIELQFHDNRSAQSWMYYYVHLHTWRYGYGVDTHMGYP